MSLSIRTNVASLNAQRNLSQTQSQLEVSMARLSSGMRITKASDDAAGLGISVNLEAQIKSYNQAARNANDGISFVQTAEGSLNEVSNILSRLRELAMQSASDGVGSEQRTYISNEATALTGELDRIGKTAEFNGKKFFGADAGTMTFQVGIRGTTDDAITVTTNAISKNGLGLGTYVAASTTDPTPAVDPDNSDDGQVGGDPTPAVDPDNSDDNTVVPASGFDVSSADKAKDSLASIDAAINTVSGYRADLGTAGNRFQSVANSVQSAVENLSAADSRIRDVDVAAETSNLSRTQILTQAGISVLAQANQAPQMALKLLG